MSITGIKRALEESLPFSFVYVFTDARAKDYSLTEQVLSLIQQKQSQVIFVMTGDCGDVNHPGFKAYEKIASTSSGQVFLLQKSQVKNIMDFVRVAVSQKKVNLLALDRTLDSAQPFFYELPVDSKLQEFTISVSGHQPQIVVRDPQGRMITEENGLQTLLDLSKARIVNVKKPTPGLWTLNIGANGEATVRVTGLSSFDFSHGFSRKPTLHLGETTARPVSGIRTHVLVNTTDLDIPGRIAGLELVSMHGDLLMEMPIVFEPSRPSLYNTSAFIPPNDFFYLKIAGVDGHGYNFQRITPTAISAV
jgi:hemicentin